MALDVLVEVELQRHDWAKIREVSGRADHVPRALRDLIGATTPEAAKTAYWKLENHVVVQGSLFEAALYVVPVLCAALVNPDRPTFVRGFILELLYQILNGYPARTEQSLGMNDMSERCKTSAREGLWLFYREFQRDTREMARYVIELIETDSCRLAILENTPSRTEIAL
jgi:hypothetical protein